MTTSANGVVVVMLDQSDLTLHRTSSYHLVTRCGIELAEASVGPWRALVGRTAQFCTGCWGANPPGQAPLFDTER